ncbi:uncharacterized protein LOC132713653 [Ruditapes philippinarum]|uniref:uncharacterized protein LOC132713653 n=1 Tax=Ruditapes philippinarum TaxID=129788 RepID=UPI00295C1A43|nr:uncharacterized protein LOC132713653 [Ruditapes philippinarum]
MFLLALCLLPVVFSAPVAQEEKRWLFSGFNVSSLFDLDALKCDVQIILDVLGKDPSEHACEAECYKIVQDGSALTYGCPLVCHSIQNLAHYFHETPKPGDASMPCGGLNILDLFGRK